MKMLVTFTLEHRPGALVEALRVFSELGINLENISHLPCADRASAGTWLHEFTVACYCSGNAQYSAEQQCTLARFRLRQHCKGIAHVFINGNRMYEEAAG